MSKKDYVKDYDLIETIDEKGRIHKEVVYKGEYFGFAAPNAEVKSAAKNVLILSLGMWIFFILPLCFNNDGFKHFWVAVPYIFSAVPIWKLNNVGIKTLKSKEKIEAKESKYIKNNAGASSFFAFVFSLICFVGLFVGLVIGLDRLNAADILILLSCGINTLLGFKCFKLRKLFETVQL